MVKRFTFGKLIGISLALMLGCFATVELADVWITPPDMSAPQYSTRVLDRYGETLRLFTTDEGYWRLPVTLDQVDGDFQRLLLAYEDQRFYQHGGVDPLSMSRALLQFLSRGRVVSGGSTITMQLVRLLEPRPRTLQSKLVEIFRAWQIESRYSKQQILQRYLELAPYGGNIQGVAAASQFYFGKQPDFLTLDEKALLIALPQSPEVRRPDLHPVRARQTRDHVAEVLHQNGYISNKDYLRALSAEVPEQRVATPFIAPHLTERLRLLHPQQQKIQSSLDKSLQLTLQRLLTRRQQALPEGVTVAAMIVDNQSAEARAYVGSGDYFSSRFAGQVDMLTAIRSPGSTLKPFIYGMGFEQGIIHPQTIISDRDEAVAGYRPANFDGLYAGEMSIHDALIKSRNIPAIKVLDRIGPDRFQQRFDDIGVSLFLPEPDGQAGLPIALGGVGIRLEELISLYTAISQAGRHRQITYETAINASANSLLSHTAAWYLLDSLADALKPQGYLAEQNRKVAFKTGTSYGFHDAWSIGFNYEYTVAIWIGRPDGGFTPGLYGLKNATPVMLEAFALLPQSGLAGMLADKPDGLLLSAREQLPAELQVFGQAASALIQPIQYDRPKIRYPVDNSQIMLAKGQAIKIKASGGVAPYIWLENGRPVSQTENGEWQWCPEHAGQVTLAMIDANGKSDRVHLTLR